MGTPERPRTVVSSARLPYPSSGDPMPGSHKPNARSESLGLTSLNSPMPREYVRDRGPPSPRIGVPVSKRDLAAMRTAGKSGVESPKAPARSPRPRTLPAVGRL
jgi:hypothetical protein